MDESGIRERYECYISKAVIDGTINYSPISFDAIHSVCALPETSKNTELFNLLYTLNEETRGCLKQECDNLRWNNYYPRCRRCFCPGLCYSCTIPSIYELDHVKWEDRCLIFQTNKQHRSYYLCGSVLSIRWVKGGLLFCEPKTIVLFGPGINVLMFVGYNVILCLRRKTQQKCKMYIHARPCAVSVCKRNSSNMSFLDIKDDPAKRTAPVDEYVKAMKTVRKRNMVNRETKLAIGE